MTKSATFKWNIIPESQPCIKVVNEVGLWSSPAPTLLHNWLKGLVNAPIPVTYIELSTEHRYIIHEEHSYHRITVKVDVQ